MIDPSFIPAAATIYLGGVCVILVAIGTYDFSRHPATNKRERIAWGVGTVLWPLAPICLVLSGVFRGLLNLCGRNT